MNDHDLDRIAGENAAGTRDDPIRFAPLSGTPEERREQLAAQREKFERDAKAGKVLCLSDLLINHGF